MRYLIAYIDASTGKDSTESQFNWVMSYASPKNAIRYGLRKDGILPGQFNIYEWPDENSDPVFVTTAYRRS